MLLRGLFALHQFLHRALQVAERNPSDDIALRAGRFRSERRRVEQLRFAIHLVEAHTWECAFFYNAIANQDLVSHSIYMSLGAKF